MSAPASMCMCNNKKLDSKGHKSGKIIDKSEKNKENTNSSRESAL